MLITLRKVNSRNNISIRLTNERWTHIFTNHDDILGYFEDILRTIENPEYIKRGYNNSLVAIKSYGKKGYLCVIYKELTKYDGFIITAYFSKYIDLKDRNVIWQEKY